MTTSLLDLVGPRQGLAPAPYGKRSLIALSHAMEDRGLEPGGPPPVVFGGFQRARFFAHDRDRYRLLAGRSALTVVAAGGLPTDLTGAPLTIGVGPEDPFWHDWVLVVYGGGTHSAVLIARDRDEHEIEGLPTRDRISDAVWTYDPGMAQACARWVGDYLVGHDAGLAGRWNDALAAMPPPLASPDAGLTAMGARLVSAMQAQVAREQDAGRRLEASYDATIAALARAAEARDPYTEEHLARVSLTAVAIGRTLGLTRTALEIVRNGARLHDVGKIGIRDAVLSKPGRLSDEEMDEMRRHSAIGAEIVARVPGLRGTVPIVRHHHERWDGRGYPDGLAGEAIPLGARIVAVADSFDAMISDRPYRDGMPRAEAVDRIRADRGSQFCPTCVDAFELVLAADDRAPSRLVGSA